MATQYRTSILRSTQKKVRRLFTGTFPTRNIPNNIYVPGNIKEHYRYSRILGFFRLTQNRTIAFSPRRRQQGIFWDVTHVSLPKLQQTAMATTSENECGSVTTGGIIHTSLLGLTPCLDRFTRTWYWFSWF